MDVFYEQLLTVLHELFSDVQVKERLHRQISLLTLHTPCSERVQNLKYILILTIFYDQYVDCFKSHTERSDFPPYRLQEAFTFPKGFCAWDTKPKP